MADTDRRGFLRGGLKPVLLGTGRGMKRPGQRCGWCSRRPKIGGTPSSLDIQGLHYRMLTSHEPGL
jgi:hypothetical protein